ncbi:hypothetical protein [Roseobacter sinensis]|uniref:Uncharacterized protein n=1 Tax=Roseobacter sinensis TaxID=2931391 RepID=A0ABT3BCP2_9RHOB|nr:hypothetical protein [Roseobacter sp. WL0113]MCV3271336.1 hypothetical protein [Roseobacter sp. WL0113]
MKHLSFLLALVATPALAHHEPEVATASPAGLVAGLVLMTLAATVALRLRRVR